MIPAAFSNLLSSLRFQTFPILPWLFTPPLKNLVFALRTTIAACLALGIALWLELDSPVWSAMTVWSVAQLTRGESLSKARWRIIGTLTGAAASIVFMSLYPQAPWLFIPMVALWIGICSGLATFVSNFRSYALVLSGYTCAIICMDVVPNTGNVFIFAVSRASYIILGVLCEAFVGLLFAFNQERAAHLKIREKLQTALTLVADTLYHILHQDSGVLPKARSLFGTILTINDQIEFAELEMGAHGHEGDHARAALAAVSALLSRGFGMATRLQLLSSQHKDFDTVSSAFLHFLQQFPKRLPRPEETSELLAELQHLRDLCRQYATPHRRKTIPVSETESSQEKTTIITNSALDERILFSSLGDLIGDLEQAISEYHASTHSIRGDHFQFQRHTHRDGKLALNNGFRAALAIIVTALIYEVTAWSNGNTLISITALICGLFATKENPVLGTMKFLKGIIAAWCTAWILCFVFIPMVKTFEPMALVLACAMMAGGLARSNPSTSAAASAFCLLMPLMLGLQNHHVINEIEFYNVNLAVVLSSVTAVVIFRSILPFNSRAEGFRLRKATLKELRNLASLHNKPEISTWVGHSTDRFSRLLRHSAPERTPLVEAAIQGTLATLTLGLNIIRLRTLLDREYLPESARRPIILVLYYVEHSSRRHDRAARLARAAISRLRELDTQDHEAIIRLEITRALTHLVVIEHTLQTNMNFLDASRPFTGEDTHAITGGSAPLPQELVRV